MISFDKVKNIKLESIDKDVIEEIERQIKTRIESSNCPISLDNSNITLTFKKSKEKYVVRIKSNHVKWFLFFSMDGHLDFDICVNTSLLKRKRKTKFLIKSIKKYSRKCEDDMD